MPDDPSAPLAHRQLADAALLHALGEDETARPVEADIRSAPWWRVRTLRHWTLRGGLSFGGLLSLALVTANAFPWWLDAAALAGGPTAQAAATVRDVDDVVLPLVAPGNAEVTFRTADGHPVRTRVAYDAEPPRRGDTLVVEYAVGSPSHAAEARGDGLQWALGDSAGLALLCLARIGWCAVSSARTTRRLVAAARSPEAQPFRYVRLRDSDDGNVWLLFFRLPGGDGDRPSHLLPVRGAGFPPSGTADVRGELADGGVAVPWIEGRAVWPAGELGTFGPRDEEFVLHLATGAVDSDEPGRPQPLV